MEPILQNDALVSCAIMGSWHMLGAIMPCFHPSLPLKLHYIAFVHERCCRACYLALTTSSLALLPRLQEGEASAVTTVEGEGGAAALGWRPAGCHRVGWPPTRE
jgi:hypothetical protein